LFVVGKDFMKSVSCTLKLTQDRDDPQTVRKCDLSIQGDSSPGSRTWALGNDSNDSRLTIGVASGPWVVYEDSPGSGSWTLYILDQANSYDILVELYALPSNFLDVITCGASLSGNGWHQGPPASDLVYNLWFGCV
jgi:hypothetical protein